MDDLEKAAKKQEKDDAEWAEKVRLREEEIEKINKKNEAIREEKARM